MPDPDPSADSAAEISESRPSGRPSAGPSLAGRRAVITGGGRGIGAATARALAEAGAEVVVSARSEHQLEAVAEELRDAGHRAHAVPCDVTDPEAVAALRERSEKLCGGAPEILVNNAGIATSNPLLKTELEEWNHIFAVNVTGVFLCTRAFVPAMLDVGWGRVVNVASVAGKMGAAYITTYSASKHAVIGFTRALAMEVATRGVTV
ncbi:MAG: SDR family oxidoreductase, partial [Holophagales bacterium]|nr:SDR family oxidoreductase [Holophagales bacterium]